MQSKYNPFSTQGLVLPEEARPAVDALVQTGTQDGAKKPENRPFRRMVDFWFHCVLLGAQEWHKRQREVPPSTRQNGFHFIEGSILEGDTAKIELLELIAIAHSKDGYAVQDANSIINLANGLAKMGFPKLMLTLELDGTNPLEKLLTSAKEAVDQG